MARTALRLRLKNSARVSWLPHLPTCHATCICAISRDDSIGFLIGFDSRFRAFFVFLPTLPRFEADRWFFLIGSAVPDGGLAVTTTTAHQIPKKSF
jgi:hypothetical protein